MIKVRDARAQIAAVLRNELQVEDFARWVMANSWNVHRDSSAEAVDLVSSIHLLLAERAKPDDDAEFRTALAELLNDIVVSQAVDVPVAKVHMRPSNASRWIPSQVQPAAA